MFRYIVTVRSSFEAAHALRTYRGITEPMHGHTWKVEAEYETDKLDSDDLSVDFIPTKIALNKASSRLDHTNLNEIPPFNDINPSTEMVAHWFWDELLKDSPENCLLKSVTVWEGPDQSVKIEKAPAR